MITTKQKIKKQVLTCEDTRKANPIQGLQDSPSLGLKKARSGYLPRIPGCEHNHRRSAISKLIPGNLITLKITAVGTNNVGINEFSYGIPVLVPNGKLGETVTVKFLKFLTVNTKKIAVAKLVKVIRSLKNKPGTQKSSKSSINTKLPTLTAGTILDIKINKLGPNSTGIAVLPNTYNNVTKVIVKNPLSKSFKPILLSGEKLLVKVTRVKKGYAFALVTGCSPTSQNNGILKTKAQKVSSLEGTKLTVVLPKEAKRYFKRIVFKVTNKTICSFNNVDPKCLVGSTVLFVKKSVGAKLGDKVQIQIQKFFKAKKCNIAVAKIIKLNPFSATQKKALVRTSLSQMLKSGMQYGEKVSKCNALMKPFVMYTSPSRPLIKKGRNIINLLKTRRCLNKALAQLTKYAIKGKTFLFVGTKKAASELVSRAALFTKKAFFVNTRWLGGMLTNWKTILKSISKIRPILKEKQMIIKDILQKRQNILTQLIQKALLLRKKSKWIVKKATKYTNKKTIQTLLNKPRSILQRAGKELILKGVLLLEKQRQLSLKQKELVLQSQTLKSKAKSLTNAYRQLLNNLILSRKKLRELKALLILSKELQVFKQQAKQDNKNLYTVSYNKYQALLSPTQGADFIITNPPKEILNKMVSLIKRDKDLNNNLNLKSVNKTKTLILTRLLSKLDLFVPTIKEKIKKLQTSISTQKTTLNKILFLINTAKNKMDVYLTLKNKLMSELRKIKQTLQVERNIIRALRRKLKQISAQKRLIKFLPKLSNLQAPANQIEQTARFLMKKFVDPKMKYPMDSLYDDKYSLQSKKVVASSKKKWQRLEKYLGGVSNMTKIKEKQIRNNVAIIIGQQEEMNAVRECKKLGIKMFHIADTNCNPGFADHYIPANDDARNSIKFILGKILTRIRLAQKLLLKFKKTKTKKVKIKNKV